MFSVTTGAAMLLCHLEVCAKESLASAKIVKIEFNVNLHLLGFPHFITFNECRKEP